jgi:trimeric autotransporter adhesin
VRTKYEQLKQQRVSEVVDRVATKVNTEEDIRAQRAGGVSVAATAAAQEDLRRTQHALLREREARLKLEAEAGALRAKCGDLEGALLVEQERVNDVSRQLLTSITTATAAAAAAQNAHGQNGHSASVIKAPIVVGQAEAAAAEAAAFAASQAAAAAREAAAAAAAMQAHPPREIMPVSAQRLAELEERLRQSDASRLSAERENAFLRNKTKALEAEAKTSKEAEMKAKSRASALATVTRTTTTEAARTAGADAAALELARSNEANAVAHAKEAERIASEATKSATQYRMTADNLQRELRDALAALEKSKAAQSSWQTSEAQMMAALDAKNAAVREAEAQSRRVKSLEQELVAAKRTASMQVAKIQARLDASRTSGADVAVLEASRREAAQATARAVAAERIAAEATAAGAELRGVVEELQRELMEAQAAVEKSTAARGEWGSSEAALMQALDAKNAAIRECDALNRRVKALEAELQTAKKASATKEAKMQAKVDALQTGR